ncbi:MAG: HAMP domain-containing histidine kinase [Bacteroidales bacterium]|nr:HAMP domain-containing histidine kinase [Bacteroidales bacterium]
MSTWAWIGILAGSCIIVALLTAWWVSKRNRDKVAYMMDALEDGETNFRFRDNTAMNRELNRIRTIMDRQSAQNEDISWSKLFRVITHEMMNTVTPIAALSDALAKDDSLDVKAGLETISTSSRELVRFVESYRSFTKATPPVCKTVLVSELLDRVVRLNEVKATACNATLSYAVNPADLLLYADESQLMQVFNNLIKNALEANATEISIVAELDSENRTMIQVRNNGQPVPLRQHEEIFVPFYSTKSNGSGIGLSLSRRIMQRHKGSLVLRQSDRHQTVFALIFP